ncbi:MAG: hypothetical protein CML68_24795 [Rhodobacteraceae bacterium]|nr:hypothetical protein [Paracoccaceae bacterium]
MTRDRLARLLPVARAKYEAEFASVRALLQAEAHVRGQLARLDDLVRAAREDAREVGPMQLLGADVLFEKNVARNRAYLNQSLARILAQKETAMVKVRHAFGRKHAIEVTEQRLAIQAAKDKTARQRDAALAPWLDGSPPSTPD